MKVKGYVKIFIALIIIVGLGYVVYQSPAYYEKQEVTNEAGEKEIQNGDKILGFGIKDVQIGHGFKDNKYYVFEPVVEQDKATEVPEGTEAPKVEPIQITDELLNNSKEIMIKRLEFKGVDAYKVSIDYENKKIIAELPNIEDIDSISSYIGKKGELQFTDFEGNVVLEENDIKAIVSTLQPLNDGTHEWYVSFQFTDEGRVKFAQATETISKKEPMSFDMGGQSFDYPTNFVAVSLDGEQIQAFTVSEKIDSPSAEIGLENDTKLAKELTALKGMEKLPCKFNIVDSKDITTNFDTSFVSLIIKICLAIYVFLFLFMAIRYKLSGITGFMSLILFGFLYIILISMTKIPITVTSIIGVILATFVTLSSIIVILENMNKQFKVGKSLRGSIESAYENSMKIITNSTVIMSIISLILLLCAQNSLKGFNKLFLIGLILSLIIVGFNKFLLTQISNIGFNNSKLFIYNFGKKKDKKGVK